ncbi:MAG: SIR2 family protein [Gammaproteobacteria bacterium]|nr:SIR2 family protein [Gammaproteobacteria bacterium]
MSEDTHSKIAPYLDEIASRLWSNSAAVMVGAGFSRNAKPVESTTASFPSWQELGDFFYEKLHGHSPAEEAKYLSLLKLAEQVQAAFGRPALDELLRRAIPNLGYEPSPLHSQLLNLPWKDVFTTNYDTLLERARSSVTLKHYDVVATEEDLLYANTPRIVKLHGSFPSAPFVITEEDYRRYPQDHAPFVNTVRQSLLENTLCLIGFSGDDPNFLQWIGWMRDHLGKESAPKIYLVGVFRTLTEADRRLLDGRGIVAVDLSEFSLEPSQALVEFLECLKKRKTRAADWPIESAGVQSWTPEASFKELAEIAAEWRHQRGEYPGWVVLPEDRRRVLWRRTQSWLSPLSRTLETDRAELKGLLDLDLAFELAWRLDRCLVPLTGELPTLFEGITRKYGGAKLRLPKKTNWTEKSVFEAVSDIRLWLLRHYREEGQDEEWQAVKQTIMVSFAELRSDQQARFRLEEALQALFRFDPAKSKQLLVNWGNHDSPPFWEAKRAALMAELGEAETARSILETSLSAIRQQLSLNPVIEDYTLVSQESVVMLLLWTVERGMSMTEPGSKDSYLLDELSERWNKLARYKCDPLREIESLSAKLQYPSEGWKQESKSYSFDLGWISRSFHFGSDEEALAAHGLLRMYEQFGMPYRMEHATFVKKPVESTLIRARPYWPHWALVNIVRLADAKATDGLFDREYVAGLSQETADGLLEIYLPALERTVAMIGDADWSEAKTCQSLAKTLPEVLSRLCYKASSNYRERLLVSLRAIYGSTRKHMFTGVSRFASRLFDSMSVEERARTVPSLVDFPVPSDLSEIEVREFTNPLLLVKLPESTRGRALAVSTERVNELLDQFAQEVQHRDWTATTLAWLHLRDKLNGPQSKRFGALLWDRVSDSEMPTVTGFHSFAFITLPHPTEIDPKPRVKKHLQMMFDEAKADNHFDDVFEELRKSADEIKWSNEEALEWVGKLLGWWNKKKDRLQYQESMPFGSPADHTRRSARKAIGALSAVLSHLPEKLSQEEDIEPLREFLANLKEHGVPARWLQAAVWYIEGETQESMTARVAVAMLHNDHDEVVDALSAAQVLAREFAASEAQSNFAPVANMLVQGVQWRHRPALSDRLRVVEELVINQSWFLSADALANLLVGIDEIATETSIGIRGNDEDGVILIRAAAASLAFALSSYLETAKLGEPEAIRRWREICVSPNEFSEVRNAWMKDGG